jgi:hypothetical protein
MKKDISVKELLYKFAEYSALTDDEIIKQFTVNGKLDFKAAIDLMIFRDFCKFTNDNFTKKKQIISN